jgi:hypothetical protein
MGYIMLYVILILLLINLLLTIVLSIAIARLIGSLNSRAEIEDFVKLAQRQPSYADVETHYDGVQLRAKNFDGLKIFDNHD